MILTNIENNEQNKTLSLSIQKCITKVKETNNFEEFTVGSYKLEGENITFGIQEYDAKCPCEGFWESHKKMVDVQVVLKGYELMKFQNVSKLSNPDHNLETDFIKYDNYEAQGEAILEAGDLFVFYPEDGHMPGLRVDGQSPKVRKVIFKIPVTEM